MRGVLFLAWSYLTFHRARSLLLLGCLVLVFVLPLSIRQLVEFYSAELVTRSEATPLLLGARGNPYDLVLNALYFRAEDPQAISMADADAVNASGYGAALSLHNRFTGRPESAHSTTTTPKASAPLVGTAPEYFRFRGLSARHGQLPALLGDVVAGAKVARSFNLRVGDPILSDQGTLYDIAATFPLRMQLVGILEETGQPDDLAFFVDLKTAWVIEGIGHGHEDLAEATGENGKILYRDAERIVAGQGLTHYNEITDENRSTFHFHGEASSYPITAAIVIPEGRRGRTLLEGRFAHSPTHQLLVPSLVVGELLGVVAEVERFFSLNYLVILLATALFLVLIITLSIKIRQREIATMHKMGCSRSMVLYLQGAELLILFCAALLISWALSHVFPASLPFFTRILQT